jgi:hypothetical protein
LPFQGLVLFVVENSTTFESLARRRPAATANLALIYASGHLCSAKRLRMRKTGQRDPGITGCQHADAVLLPAIRRYGKFVDQEGFDPAPIRGDYVIS